LVAAAALPALGIVGASFLPPHDISEFNIVVETPPGSNLASTKSRAQEVARLARALPEVVYTYVSVGDGAAGGPGSGGVDEGNVYVRLKPRAERERHQLEIERALRRDLQRIGGATAWISNDPVRNTKQIQVQLRGPAIAELNRIAQQFADVLRQVPGAVDVGLSMKAPKPEVDVELDRPLAGALGITVAQVAQALRPAFAGIDAGDWADPLGETRDVTLRLAADARTGVADVQKLPIEVTRPDGSPTTVPLGQIATVTSGLGPARIDHLDRERVMYVQANTDGRPLSDVVREFNARVESVALPRGYELSHGGERQDQRGVFRRILIALGIGLALMYLVHVVQFESFLDPLPVILSLPTSLVGAMLALALTGSTLNIMSMIGLILLMGIVAKNAILLIDFAKAAERNGADRRTAIVEAGRARLRPILMTTFALVAGMVPVALGIGEGADFRAPLGRAVLGGVLTSTVLTLFVIPAVYDVLSESRDRALAFRRGKVSA
jgi:HAE1 family hydrophobic/amphiphilic exporter-1